MFVCSVAIDIGQNKIYILYYTKNTKLESSREIYYIFKIKNPPFNNVFSQSDFSPTRNQNQLIFFIWKNKFLFKIYPKNLVENTGSNDFFPTFRTIDFFLSTIWQQEIRKKTHSLSKFNGRFTTESTGWYTWWWRQNSLPVLLLKHHRHNAAWFV